MNYLFIYHKIFSLKLLLLGIATFFVGGVMAQIPTYYQDVPKNNEGEILTVNILFGDHFTAGDLADRFGNHLSIGLGVDYITKNDLVFGASGHFLFGNNVKEDVIANVRNEDGLIFGDQGGIAAISLRQRGINIGGYVGKLFRLKEESRSGIRATIGAGMLQHKIRIQDDPQASVPQLNSDYKKGYDRLTNGLSLTQFIGYQHLGQLRRANFFIGIELTEGFTQNRRNFNFDTMTEDNQKRFDMSYGIRIGWLLPFYLGEDSAEIRY